MEIEKKYITKENFNQDKLICTNIRRGSNLLSKGNRFTYRCMREH